MPRRPWPLPALALLLLPTFASSDAPKPERPALTPESIKAALRADWYGVYLQDQKLGYMKSAFARAGRDGFAADLGLHLKLRSSGAPVEFRMEQQLEFDARPPHRLRRARSVQAQDGSRQETTLLRDGDRFVVTTVTGKDRETRKVPALDYTLADLLAASSWLAGRPAVGATLHTRDLNLDELRLDPERRRVLARQSAVVRGVKVTYYEVETFQPRQKLTTLERHDEEGNLISGKIGDGFEVRLESEAQAKDFDGSADVGVLGQVKIDRTLGDPRKVTSLIVEVTGKEGGILEAGPRQSVARAGEGKWTLKLGKAHGKPVRAAAEEVREALAATASYPAEHPRVRELARKAVGDAKTDRVKAERLVKFVHGYLRPSYRVKGLVVLDLLERREGDCTAYAALFTTLARAAGLPAREVSGLAYVGDAQKAFGGHAWNEVVIDGHWVPVDASCGQAEIDAAHISLGPDLRGGVNLLRAAGNLSLRLVEVERKE